MFMRVVHIHKVFRSIEKQLMNKALNPNVNLNLINKNLGIPQILDKMISFKVYKTKKENTGIGGLIVLNKIKEVSQPGSTKKIIADLNQIRDNLNIKEQSCYKTYKNLYKQLFDKELYVSIYNQLRIKKKISLPENWTNTLITSLKNRSFQFTPQKIKKLINYNYNNIITSLPCHIDTILLH